MPGLITDVLAQGVHASRPAVPDASSSTLSLWFSTDTEALYLYDWNDAAWQTIPLTAGVGDLLAANNLSDVSNVLTAAENLGVGVTDSPQFAGLNLGHATDTTLTRTGAGDIAVEGNAVYRAGGTDVPVTDGGTGASTAAAARVNILPALATNTLKTLRVNAGETDVEWATASAFTAATTTEQLTGTSAAVGSTPDSVAALWEQGSDVASAGTVSLGEGGYFFITGTTTITDIDFATDKAGRTAWVKFAGALTLTNGANLILPGGANILTAAGDTACFISEGSDVIRCVAYQRAIAAPFRGSYEAGTPTPPTTADFATWDNQGTSTVTDGTGAMILKPQVDDGLHGLYKAAPGTPYDVYCRVELSSLSSTAVTTNVSVKGGILFKDTGGDNERLFFCAYTERVSGDEQNLYGVFIQRWTGASPPVISSTLSLRYANTPFKWIRVNNDGTTLTFYFSIDGKNWISVGTETLAAFIDGAASYGVAAVSTASSTEAIVSFSYFSTTAPA